MRLRWTWNDPERLGGNHQLNEEHYLLMLMFAMMGNQLVCFWLYISFVVDMNTGWKSVLTLCLGSLVAILIGLELSGEKSKDPLFIACALLNPGSAVLVGVVVTPLTGVELYDMFYMSGLSVLVCGLLLLPMCRNKTADHWQKMSRRSSRVVLSFLALYCLTLVYRGLEVFYAAVMASLYSAWVIRTFLLGMTLERTTTSIAVTLMAIPCDLIIYLRMFVSGNAGTTRRSHE